MMNMKFRTFPLITISCVTGDQPRPGSFLKKREEPGNEVGHLTVASACSGRHLTTYFIKSKIPRGYPGGGGLVAVGFDSYITTDSLFAARQMFLTCP